MIHTVVRKSNYEKKGHAKNRTTPEVKRGGGKAGGGGVSVPWKQERI